MTNALLIDLSSIAHPIFHMEIDPSAVSTRIVERVRALASEQPHVGVCVEGGRSFRKDLDPTYKANRPESDAILNHQIDVAVDILRADGFPILRADGFEADDVIATASSLLLSTNREMQDVDQVIIASADKDLLQLVSPNLKAWKPDGTEAVFSPACVVKSLKDGSIIDAAAVEAKFGVRPDQILDFLALVGDPSDNIKGCTEVGKVRAAGLLKKYGSIDGLYKALDGGESLTPALTDSLHEFRSRVEGVKALLRLRTDAPIDVSEVLKERVPADVAEFGAEETSYEDVEGYRGGGSAEAMGADRQIRDRSVAAVLADIADGGNGRDARTGIVAGSLCSGGEQSRTEEVRNGSGQYDASSNIRRIPEVVEPAPIEWALQLEPRNMAQMKALAVDLFASRLVFSSTGYGHPAGILSTILAGREIGLPAMASMRAFHLIDGRPTLAADLIRGLVLKSGVCEYFRPTERTNERATFVAKRKGDPEISLTFTVEDARRAWTKGDKAWEGSGWNRNPADMCVARAGSKLARLVAPDVVSGLYAPEELES